MSVTIYRYGTLIARATLDVDEDSQQAVALMDADTITLNFSVPQPISFKIGDYMYWFDRYYKINKRPSRTKTASRSFAYVLVLEGTVADLGAVQVKFLDANNNFTQTVFSFRGTPKDFGDLIVYNMLRVAPGNPWQLGNVVEGDFMDKDFSGENCLEALKDVATLFNTEYLVDGYTIHIAQMQVSSKLTLMYGDEEALIQITDEDQNNSNVITRLFAYGSTRNIGNQYDDDGNIVFTYRGGLANLQMGDQDFVEKNVELYPNQFEQTVLFDGSQTDPVTNTPLPEIYPHRTGTITAVADYLNFIDTDLDFDIHQYLISGVTAQIVFNTGLLAGYTFDIAEYDNATKKITINQNTSQSNLVLPSASITANVGDEYVLVNILMPPSYIAAAEAALKSAAIAYLNKYSVPLPKYTLVCNIEYFKKNAVKFAIGNTMSINDDDLLINRITRVISFTRNINNPWDFSITLADTVAPNSLIVQLINGL